MSQQAATPKPFAKWSPLSDYVNPDDVRVCMLAQSALSGPDLGQCPPLTIEQARDVLAWHHPKY